MREVSLIFIFASQLHFGSDLTLTLAYGTVELDIEPGKEELAMIKPDFY